MIGAQPPFYLLREQESECDARRHAVVDDGVYDEGCILLRAVFKVALSTLLGSICRQLADMSELLEESHFARVIYSSRSFASTFVDPYYYIQGLFLSLFPNRLFIM